MSASSAFFCSPLAICFWLCFICSAAFCIALLACWVCCAACLRACCDFLPWGVDCATGVEGEDRRKDPAKMKAFIEAVRRAEMSEMGESGEGWAETSE